MSYLVAALVSILVIIYLEFKLKTWREETLLLSFKRNFDVLDLLSISFLFATSMLFVSLVLERVGVFARINESFSLEMLPYILYSVSVLPFTEEYFYRFLPCKIFLNKQYLKYVAVISELIFSFGHSLIGFEYAFIFCMALILFYIYFKTRNILYSFFSHSFYNIFVYLNYYIGFDNIFILLIIIISMLVLYRSKIYR